MRKFFSNIFESDLGAWQIILPVLSQEEPGPTEVQCSQELKKLTPPFPIHAQMPQGNRTTGSVSKPSTTAKSQTHRGIDDFVQ